MKIQMKQKNNEIKYLLYLNNIFFNKINIIFLI